MKSIISLALILLVSQVTSATTTTAKKAISPSHKKSNLGTSFKFDGSALRGKYNSSMNLAATVENDKILEDLLKGRTQFEDRANEEKDRN